MDLAPGDVIHLRRGGHKMNIKSVSFGGNERAGALKIDYDYQEDPDHKEEQQVGLGFFTDSSFASYVERIERPTKRERIKYLSKVRNRKKQ